MPSTRKQTVEEYTQDSESDEGSEVDPEYWPSDSDKSVECLTDHNKDRLLYIRQYKLELAMLHDHLLQRGQDVMGPAFMQFCDPVTFANFCYKCTTP